MSNCLYELFNRNNIIFSKFRHVNASDGYPTCLMASRATWQHFCHNKWNSLGAPRSANSESLDPKWNRSLVIIVVPIPSRPGKNIPRQTSRQKKFDLFHVISAI